MDIAKPSEDISDVSLGGELAQGMDIAKPSENISDDDLVKFTSV